MWYGTVAKALGGLAARPHPEADRRDLRKLADLVEHVKNRMIELEIPDRILAGGKRFAELGDPRIPRVLAPEIIGPQETALEQVVAQPRRLLLVEVRAARLGHHDERTLEQLLVRQTQQDVLVLALRAPAHRQRRQLGETIGEVDVRPGPIDVPAVSVAVARVAKHDPAELEATVVGRVLR